MKQDSGYHGQNEIHQRLGMLQTPQFTKLDTDPTKTTESSKPSSKDQGPTS